jgi:hypothetical protein
MDQTGIHFLSRCPFTTVREREKEREREREVGTCQKDSLAFVLLFLHTILATSDLEPFILDLLVHCAVKRSTLLISSQVDLA